MYDKPLFADKGSSLYRPKAATEDELAAGGGAAEGRHFKPDRGFAGVDYGAATRGGGGPVQFEKDQEEDPFGLEVGAEIWEQILPVRAPRHVLGCWQATESCVSVIIMSQLCSGALFPGWATLDFQSRCFTRLRRSRKRTDLAVNVGCIVFAALLWAGQGGWMMHS